MKISKLFCVLFLELFLLAILAGDTQAQKGKPQPPPPPPTTQPDPAFAYVVSGNNQYDLMVMDADGSHQLTVISQKFTGNTEPDWSPDGKRLALAREIYGNLKGLTTGLYVVNVDKTGLKWLANSSLQRPAWSPVPLGDGKNKIAFPSRLMPDGTIASKSDLFLVNEDGSGLTRLTDTPDLWEFDIDWSPLANRLAVDSFDGVTEDLVIYRVDCGIDQECSAVRERGLFNIPGSPLEGRGGFGFDWAKTQDRIVVSANTASDGTYDLWIIDPDNLSSPLQLTSTPGVNEYNPTWSPDDARIAFTSNPRGGPLSLEVMNSNGTNRTTIPLPAGLNGAWGVNWRRNP